MSPLLVKWILDYKFAKEVYQSDSQWKADFDYFKGRLAEFRLANNI